MRACPLALSLPLRPLGLPLQEETERRFVKFPQEAAPPPPARCLQ